MAMQAVETGKAFTGRLAHGADLLAELTRLCTEHGIRFGRVEAIGAVQCARIGFYDQAAREYVFQAIERPLEIVSLLGNISIKDGAPMVHAHIALADREGRILGGHLAEGTILFAGEAVLQPFSGPPPVRAFDEPTGLSLWPA